MTKEEIGVLAYELAMYGEVSMQGSGEGNVIIILNTPQIHLAIGNAEDRCGVKPDKVCNYCERVYYDCLLNNEVEWRAPV